MTVVDESNNSGVTLAVLKDLQKTYVVTASRALGQNFLVDPNISRKIADTIESESNVIEVGPGIGSLSVPLARRAKYVYAIELDQHILEPLAEVLSRCNVSDKVDVINADVMDVNLEQMCIDNNVDTIIGNLPYNISAPLLANIARHVPSAHTLVAMVQKEVGERLGAPQATREVSSITYKVQYYMEVSTLFSVPRQSFVPQPRVDSIVIQLKRRAAPAVDVEPESVEEFFAMIDTAFSQRRKMLRKSLSVSYGNRSNNIFQRANVDPTLRPEQCTLEDFAALFHASKNVGEQ